MKRLIALVSQKGGVGKTTAAIALADRYRRDGKPVFLVDGDKDVGGLLQVFGARDKSGKLLDVQPDTGVTRFAMHGDERDRDMFVDLLDRGHPTVLVDMPAGAVTRLIQIDRELGFFDLLAQVGYRLTLVSPITPKRPAIASVTAMLSAFKDSADYVVFRNDWFGAEEDYALWYGTKDGDIPVSNAAKLLKQYGGQLLVFPRLGGTADAKLDICSCPPSVPLNCDKVRAPGGQEITFRLSDKSRLARFLKDWDSELNKAAPYFGLEVTQCD